MPSKLLPRRSPVLVVAVAGWFLQAGCNGKDSKPPDCFIPDPCGGDPQAVELTFRSGVSEADVKAVNESVGGKIMTWYSDIQFEQIAVPGDLCAALDKLQHDPRVNSATPLLYLRNTPRPSDAGCPPPRSVSFLQDGGDLADAAGNDSGRD